MTFPAGNLRCHRSVAALLGGLSLVAAFPKIGFAGLGWVAPTLILFSGLGAGSGACFRLGYLAGLAYWLSSLYWLLFIPYPIGAVTGWIALSLFLALYPAVWVWGCWRLLRPFPPSHRVESARDAIVELLNIPLWRRVTWALQCAALWVALEIFRGWFLTGFPWSPLAASQYRMLPLIQICSVTGVPGLSFLMVWFAVALGFASLKVGRPGGSSVWIGDLALPALTVAASAAFGMSRLTAPQAGSARTLKVALIQPSIPQTLIWDPNETTNRFHQLIDLSRQALEAKPDLLIWPEAATPGLIRYEIEIYKPITDLARSNHVWMILGGDDAELRDAPAGGRVEEDFNASFLVSPEGDLAAPYHKQHLVMFGEYVPWVGAFPFLKKLAPVGNFTPGTEPAQFEMPGLKATASVLICFEDGFPSLARKHVRATTDFLVNLTNDGWFGESAAQWQQAASSVFRAVENGVPLVRCANNGLTCWIDARGVMRNIYFPDSDDVYKMGYKIAEIQLPPAGAPHSQTFYWRHGAWFGSICVAATAFGIAAAARQRLVKKSPAR